MAKLTIQTKGGLGYISSRLKILIDGKEVETMRRKQTKEIELTNENHRLQIVSRWPMISREVPFDSGTPKIFQVSVNPLINLARVYLLIILIVILIRDILSSSTQLFQSKVPSNQLWMFIVPGLLTILYFITIGRKYFLIVKESKELNLSLL